LSGCGMKKTEVSEKIETPEKKLESFYSNPRDYENIFSEKEEEKQKIIAGIISHHFLAKSLIADFFSKISPENVETVIIIGPDHFNKLENLIATSKLSWKTPFGDLPANQDLIGKIIEGDISENDVVFYNEHSVYTLMPFVKKVFPEAKVVPLIVNSRYDFEKLYNLGKMVRSEAGDKTILIISSDFSHHATISEAMENDKKSIQALQNLKLENLNNVTCDCRNCLAFALGFTGEGKKFVLLDNKNSADFDGGDKDITSYVAGYYIDEK